MEVSAKSECKMPQARLWACGRGDVSTPSFASHLNPISTRGGQIMPSLYWCPHQVLKATGVLAMKSLLYVNELWLQFFVRLNSQNPIQEYKTHYSNWSFSLHMRRATFDFCVNCLEKEPRGRLSVRPSEVTKQQQKARKLKPLLIRNHSQMCIANGTDVLELFPPLEDVLSGLWSLQSREVG